MGVVSHGDENLIVPPSDSTSPPLLPPPAHFLNLSGHGLPPAPPLSGAHLMLRSVDKNLRHSSALKRILCDAHNPPFHLMWTQTHAKAWGKASLPFVFLITQRSSHSHFLPYILKRKNTNCFFPYQHNCMNWPFEIAHIFYEHIQL